jgi:tetratricopeptide (TPR) repeat protein
MEVRIETSGRARIAFAYTDGTGEFAFRDVRLQPSELYYIVIEEEGFEPYRERLDDFVHRDFGGYLALFLEPEARAPEETGPGGAPVVDIGQLLLDVPDDVRQDFEEARELSDEGRHREAAERLEDVVARVPEFYEAFEALGASYLWLERFEDARTALVRAHDLSPRSPGPLLNLGTVLYRQGESFEATGERERAGDVYGQSVDVLRGAIDRDPFSGPAYLRLGAALYKLGELEEAEIALLRALELSPELGDARLMLVNVYVRQLKFDEALIQVDLFREANPDSPYATALAETRLQIESQLGPAGP